MEARNARALRDTDAPSMLRRRCVAGLGTGAALAALPRRLSAATYPARTVRLVVGQAPGGQSDTIARLIGQHFAVRWKQAVVVENFGGAAGTIAARMVLRAPADGYTLLVGSNATLSALALQSGAEYQDPARDWTLVGRIVRVGYVLVVRQGLGVASLRELVARAGTGAESISMATVGAGSNAQRALRLFEKAARVRVLEVPFKGGLPALQSVVAGQVDAVFCDLALALPSAATGAIRILAVAGPKRLVLAPEVPTCGEAGLPGVAAEPWYALVAPAAAPADVVAELDAALHSATTDTEVERRFAALGYAPIVETREEFAAALTAEVEIARAFAPGVREPAR